MLFYTTSHGASIRQYPRKFKPARIAGVAGILLLLAAALPARLSAQHSDEHLQEMLEEAVQDFRGRAGIYVRHLRTGQTARVNADNVFPTASLIKVPILLTIFSLIEEGKLDYAQPLVFRDSLRYDAPEDILYWYRDGAEISLSEVVMLMLTVSDNTASLCLERLIGKASPPTKPEELKGEIGGIASAAGGIAINNWLAAHGYEHTRVNSGVPGRAEAFRKYGWGQTTPREMATMLVRIRKGEAVSPAASAAMYRMLTRSYIDGVALSQIPPYVQAASKQGWVSRSKSEVVLVNAPHGDYVFCIATAEQEDAEYTYDNEGSELIRRVSALLLDYFEPESGWEPVEGMERYREFASEE